MKSTLLSAKELASELGVSVQSIRRAYWKGTIPGYRICKVVRFDIAVALKVFHSNGLERAVRTAAVRIGDSRPRGKDKRPR
jgi:hypothetical protein